MGLRDSTGLPSAPRTWTPARPAGVGTTATPSVSGYTPSRPPVPSSARAVVDPGGATTTRLSPDAPLELPQCSTTTRSSGGVPAGRVSEPHEPVPIRPPTSRPTTPVT